MMDQSVNQLILKALRQASGVHVSGETLAAILGLSRVAIWKRIDCLSQEGFKFEAIRNRGYRLLEEPRELQVDLLKVYFEEADIRYPLYFMDRVDSTNTEGLRRLSDGAIAPGLVVAKAMSAGRARLGRSWAADDTGNLYCSFIFRPNQPLEVLSRFSLWVGLTVCEALKTRWDIPLMLKWPNDLLFNGKKLAGMLADSTIDTDHVRHLVFGIGLNVNSHVEAWPADIAKRATSLAVAKKETLPLHAVATLLAKTVFTAYESYMNGSYTERFETLWSQFNALKDAFIKVRRGDTIIEGQVMGLNPMGALRLRDPHGNEIAIHAGDVTLSGA